ncbi:MAG: hypothetical protein JNK89_02535, partial [Saprospiraceae bacterium]|nr:hypothetical protein [Saprospiraceae bacterium]
DVENYEVQIRLANTNEWSVLATYDTANMVDHFIDSITFLSPLRRRMTWEYRVLAIDEAGMVSSSAVVRTKALDVGLRDSIQDFTATYFPAAHQVRLTWDYPQDVDLVGFQIFRAIDTSQMRSYRFVSPMLSTFAGSDFMFIDTDLNMKQLFVKKVFTQPVNGTGVPVNPTKVNAPLSQAPNAQIFLHYQVMAVFADGAQSPLSPIQTVQIQ